jgi:acyl-CoA thioesterase FadM
MTWHENYLNNVSRLSRIYWYFVVKCIRGEKKVILEELIVDKMGQSSEWITLKNIATVEVRVGDINYGGHMGNDKALLVFHDARLRFLESMGFSEKNIGGAGIIMRDAHIAFRKEVFLHDVLLVDAGIDEVTATSFNMIYTVRREADDEIVFTGSTSLVAFDYEVRRVVRIPEAFLKKISVGQLDS